MSFYFQDDYLDDVLGSGIDSLEIFSNYGTKVALGIEKINDSIYTILSTRVGERLFLPEFGSKLYTVNFEQNSQIARDLIEMYIRESLEAWEKRITVTDIEILEEDDNVLPVEINYQIKDSNLYESYVYPFNLGTDGSLSTYNL